MGAVTVAEKELREFLAEIEQREGTEELAAETRERLKAMTAYQQTAAENIRKAHVRRGRGAWVADKAHAAVFLSLQEFGLELFQMDRGQVLQALKSSAYTMLEFKSIWTGWLNGVLRWAIGLLVPVVWEWFLAKVQEWLDRNRTGLVNAGAGEEKVQRCATLGALREMIPMFDEARRVLGGGR